MYRVVHLFMGLVLVLVVNPLLPSCRSVVSPVVSAPTTLPAPTRTPIVHAVSTATAPPAPWTSAADGIQAALDVYTRAYTERDAKLFNRAIDQDNVPFRRFMQARFAADMDDMSAGDSGFDLYLLSVTERPYGFVQAHIEADDGYVADWLFRYDTDHWVISEPTIEQLGPSVRVEREHFIFVTYPWADAINPTIMQIAEAARQRAVQRLGREPTQKAMVQLLPICGLAPYEDSAETGFYEEGRAAQGPDQIIVFTPQSIRFDFYDPQAGWQSALRTLFTHEYTHMIHARSFNDAGGSNTWMSEGLAEYIAEHPRAEQVSDAIQESTIIPLTDPSSIDDKQDLAHIYTLHHHKSLAYGLSYSVVAYIVEYHGGLAGFWKLARAYDRSGDLDTSLREAFGITYKAFAHDWRAWLKDKYPPYH